MIEEFVVYVIVDHDGTEIDRFFHEWDANYMVDYLNHINDFDRYSIIHRLVCYSE